MRDEGASVRGRFCAPAPRIPLSPRVHRVHRDSVPRKWVALLHVRALGRWGVGAIWRALEEEMLNEFGTAR
jgi:hypothetical protein